TLLGEGCREAAPRHCLFARDERREIRPRRIRAGRGFLRLSPRQLRSLIRGGRRAPQNDVDWVAHAHLRSSRPRQSADPIYRASPRERPRLDLPAGGHRAALDGAVSPWLSAAAGWRRTTKLPIPKPPPA